MKGILKNKTSTGNVDRQWRQENLRANEKKRKMVDDKNYGIQRDGICLK